MTNKEKIIYDSGIKNKQFLIDIWEADKDTKPGIFSSSIRKYIFLTAYYGWLVGKHGKDWKSFL